MTEEIIKERYIEKEEIHQHSISDSVSSRNNKPNKKKNLLIVISFIVILGIVVFFVFIFSGSSNGTQTNTIVTIENDNTNNQSNVNIDNVNVPSTNISVNEEVVLSGRVFIKAYGTPSESYGIISTDGNEIGFGAYDSMREQFRPYVNENVIVTFSNICKSTTYGCCKSVFYYCGTVSGWEGDENLNINN